MQRAIVHIVGTTWWVCHAEPTREASPSCVEICLRKKERHTMAAEPKYDLYGSSFSTFKANAHAIYRAMREHDPVIRLPGVAGQGLVWFVTRYEDVDRILRDDKRFVRDWKKTLSAEQLAALPPRLPVLELVDNHMLNKDGDDHRRL